MLLLLYRHSTIKATRFLEESSFPVVLVGKCVDVIALLHKLHHIGIYLNLPQVISINSGSFPVMKKDVNTYSLPILFIIFKRTIQYQLKVFGNDSIYICNTIRDIIAPHTIVTTIIHGSDPFSQRLSLLYIPAGFLAFRF